MSNDVIVIAQCHCRRRELFDTWHITGGRPVWIMKETKETKYWYVDRSESIGGGGVGEKKDVTKNWWTAENGSVPRLMQCLDQYLPLPVFSSALFYHTDIRRVCRHLADTQITIRKKRHAILERVSKYYCQIAAREHNEETRQWWGYAKRYARLNSRQQLRNELRHRNLSKRTPWMRYLGPVYQPQFEVNEAKISKGYK